jgi:DNA-binding transcriptional ArsR family regulator
MVVSVIVANAPPDAAQVGLSPISELVAQLHALTESEHHPQVLPRQEIAAQPELREAIYRWSPLWSAYRARFLAPARSILGRSLADELGDIADLPIPRFAEYAGYAIRGGNSGSALGRLLDDPQQQAQLRQAARLRSTNRSELVDRLLDSPAGFRTELLEFLGRYAATWFDAEWQALQPRLQAEVHRLRFQIRDRGIAVALAGLSSSTALLQHPERVVFDKLHAGIVRLDQRPCLVVPSHYGWPHLLVKHEPGWPVVIQYGLPPRDGPQEVSLALLRARLLALADPARIRLCRLIAREPITTVELALLSGMTEPQVSRHLRQLRAVDLVRSERSGRFVHYQLELGVVRALGLDLERAMFR